MDHIKHECIQLFDCKQPYCQCKRYRSHAVNFINNRQLRKYFVQVETNRLIAPGNHHQHCSKIP